MATVPVQPFSSPPPHAPEVDSKASNLVNSTSARRSLGVPGRSLLTDGFSLDAETVQAFAHSCEEDEHGSVVFSHTPQGTAEICGDAGYSFHSGVEDETDQGRSIWHAFPTRRKAIIQIMVAPIALEALAAWQVIGDHNLQLRTVLVSTAGRLGESGAKRLTNLIRKMHAIQRSQGHADEVTLVDLTGIDEAEVAGQSEALEHLAREEGIKYLRSVPPRGEITWLRFLYSIQAEGEDYAVSPELAGEILSLQESDGMDVEKLPLGVDEGGLKDGKACTAQQNNLRGSKNKQPSSRR